MREEGHARRSESAIPLRKTIELEKTEASSLGRAE